MQNCKILYMPIKPYFLCLNICECYMFVHHNIYFNAYNQAGLPTIPLSNNYKLQLCLLYFWEELDIEGL